MSKDKETLVILTPGFPKDENDSTCLPFQQLLVKDIKSCYPHLNIIVLSFQYPYHKNKYTWNGIPVIPFAGRNKGGLFKRLLRRQITETLKEINQSHSIKGLLSFFCDECAFVGKEFADKSGIRHYCWIMGQDAKKENKYPARCKFQPSELIALSNFLQEEFEKNHGVRPAHVIPPGIEPGQFKLNSTARDIGILAVGSLIPLKQYDQFLYVISEIKKQIPSIKAVLIGDGPERQKLQNRITSLGLDSNLELKGEQPHTSVLESMRRSKLFLHTSAYEGFGVVCLEALAAGCHVIGFRKVMNNPIENWEIAKDKEEMIQKAVDFLKDRKTTYKQVAPFTMHNAVKKIAELFS